MSFVRKGRRGSCNSSVAFLSGPFKRFGLYTLRRLAKGINNWLMFSQTSGVMDANTYAAKLASIGSQYSVAAASNKKGSKKGSKKGN